ncbi:hypothetical protein [Nesterenkonia halotolerans]|uniref:Uncharacterized protein n=1 Tax=Nesterenkonia halotolerans TaxID=225325 RepID=A0ABR9J7D0_9MICC|nr:hypothetical protein [Nesterenkonia halotolerans]MBE1514888.1 hypothetical protein [Nesterenkonia halotolerans]
MSDLKPSSEMLSDVVGGVRADTVFLGGFAPDEMRNLETVFALSDTEKP